MRIAPELPAGPDALAPYHQARQAAGVHRDPTMSDTPKDQQEQKRPMPPSMNKKTRPTRRGKRSVPALLRSQLIWSGPLRALAADYRRRAADLEGHRASDELIVVWRRMADEIEAAVAAGRRNEWMTPEDYAAATGMAVDTVRLHCRTGKLQPAEKRGGGWVIHVDALNPDPQQEAA